MYTECCHYLLLLALFTSTFLLVYPNRCVIGSRLLHKNLFWIISLSFFLLTSNLFGTITSYASSDFSFYNILTNSSAHYNAPNPIFFKISATWSNHEGSLLLWCWLLAFYGFVFCIITRSSCRPWISSKHSIDTDHFVITAFEDPARSSLVEEKKKASKIFL